MMKVLYQGFGELSKEIREKYRIEVPESLE